MGDNTIARQVILLVLICTSTYSLATAFNSSTDEAALLAVKAQVMSSPDNDILAKNWSQGSSFCNWIGVTCNQRRQRVAALNLFNMGLRGAIAKEIGDLSFLHFLDISHNSIQGEIPGEMSRLRRLRYLNLQSNELIGSIPTSFGLLRKLQKFILSGNKLSGIIPSSIYNISSAKMIDLSNNFLRGTLPTYVCENFVQLQVFNLSQNRLSGSIPPSLSKCTELRVLNLGSNGLSGSIPKEFGNFSKLELLYLYINNLTGELPLALFNISSIVKISLAANRISGSFPTNPCNNLPELKLLALFDNQIEGHLTLSQCKALKVFEVSNNKLSGNFPDTNNLTGNLPTGFDKLYELQVLSLHQNHFTGMIPPSIGNISSLEVFDVNYNNLQGYIPPELGYLTKLKALYLGANKLTGKVPLSIFNNSQLLETIALSGNKLFGDLHSPKTVGLPSLEGLYLASNQFTGKIPEFIFNSSKLKFLDISSNFFKGQVPKTLWNLRQLQLLSIGTNQLTNDLSVQELGLFTSLANCKYLRVLDISENPLNGVFPKCFALGNLSTSLESLNCGNCGIRGKIPSEIGNLSNLIFLNFSQNHLTGSIPGALGGMQSLQGLFLSNNKLQGCIPNSTCRLMHLTVLYLHGNKLYGPLQECVGSLFSLREIDLGSNAFTSTIPPSFWSNKDILHLDLSSNSFNGNLVQEIGALKSLVYLNLSKNQFSGGIPESLGQLQNVINLSMSENKLSGPIPASFGNMLSLQQLDLSHNELSGTIPKSMEKLKDLVYFNVSFNNLSGEIPDGGCFSNFSFEFFEGNKQLCGASQFHVQKCKTHTSNSNSWFLKYIVAPVVTLFIIASILTLLLRCQNRKPPPPSDIGSLTSFAALPRISFYEISGATMDFHESNLVGRGKFSSVYKGVLSDGRMFAIKVFNLELQEAMRSFDIECEILRNIRHRNLVKVISSCSNQDFKALVLEFMPNGDLQKLLYHQEQCPSLLQRLRIMIEVASALEYLHHGYSFPLIHCDLKPNNIFLDGNMVARVGDFGIAKLLMGGNILAQTKTIGTIGYMAPEYGSAGIVSTMTDVYSFGIVLMEMFTRKTPTDDIFGGELTMTSRISNSLPNAIMQVVDNKLRGEDQEGFAKEKCLASIMELALECTREAPEQRPNMKDIVTRLKKIECSFSRIKP